MGAKTKGKKVSGKILKIIELDIKNLKKKKKTLQVLPKSLADIQTR